MPRKLSRGTPTGQYMRILASQCNTIVNQKIEQGSQEVTCDSRLNICHVCFICRSLLHLEFYFSIDSVNLYYIYLLSIFLPDYCIFDEGQIHIAAITIITVKSTFLNQQSRIIFLSFVRRNMLTC